MRKRELVMEVASKLGFPQNEVSSIVQKTLDEIVSALQDGQRLEIRNFGIFEVKTRDARMGRNPRTGEDVPITEKRIATFKPGRMLKEWVASPDGHGPGGLFTGDGSPAGNLGVNQDAATESDDGSDSSPSLPQSTAEPTAATPDVEGESSAAPGEQQSLF